MVVTTGYKATKDETGCWRVPKTELASRLQILLQARHLKVAAALPETELLTKELMNFRIKNQELTSDDLAAWREGPHDDLVLAVAIAAWYGEHQTRLMVW